MPHPPLSGPEIAALPYRPCVGQVVINRDGFVWVGCRADSAKRDSNGAWWQMPQGGIEPGENPREAALRELEEETAIRSVEIVGELDDWLHYDLPDHLVGKVWSGRYRGQKQRWFAMRFTGDDSEIDIGARNGQKAEFSSWRWASQEDLPDLIIPFKRNVYTTVLAHFAPLITPER